MSGAGQKPGGRGRTVSADEAQLWEQATRALDRVKAKPRVGSAAEPASSQPAPRLPAVTSARTQASQRSSQPPTAAVARKSGKPSAPLAEFERRKARQIASGKIELGARIDLHGLRQDDARSRLRAFLLDAHAKGHKTVLVITGKGGEEPADPRGARAGERPRGVLRRNVPSWLGEPDLRAIVLSYTAAGVRHGGAGALYVQLRKGGR
jgi:DNA-nicking Smr family endonuclease